MNVVVYPAHVSVFVWVWHWSGHQSISMRYPRVFPRWDFQHCVSLRHENPLVIPPPTNKGVSHGYGLIPPSQRSTSGKTPGHPGIHTHYGLLCSFIRVKYCGLETARHQLTSLSPPPNPYGSTTVALSERNTELWAGAGGGGSRFSSQPLPFFDPLPP